MPITSQIVKCFRAVLFIILLSGLNGILRAQDFTIDSIGDWSDGTLYDNTLAGALQAVLNNQTIELTGNLTGSWDNWPSDSDGYTLFQANGGDKSMTVNLGGSTISGTPLAIVSGTGMYTFSGGTLGDPGDNMRFGVSGSSTLIFNSAAIQANKLEIEGTSLLPADVTLNEASSISADSIELSGLGAELKLNNTSTLTTSGILELALGSKLTSTGTGLISVGGDVDLISGGQFSASGPVTIGGDLNVGRAGVWSYDTDPVTYSNVQSTFKASGTLTIVGDAISAIDGGKIDLTGAAFAWNVDAGKSITVAGIHSHKESIKSFESELIWNGSALNVSGTGEVNVVGGGVFSGVKAISVTSGGTVTVDGALLDSDTAKKYRSTLHADGVLTVDNATFNVENGALVDGITDIVVTNNAVLSILGADAVSGYDSTIAAGGTFTLGGTTVGTLKMTDGAKLTGATAMFIGGTAQAVVDLSGVGSGNARTSFTASGNLTVANADIDIKSGALWSTTGTAVLGASGGTTLLDIGTRAGSGDGFDAAFVTGDMILADTGTVKVDITVGGSMTTGDTIMAKETGSVAEITINETYRPGEHRAWTVDGDATSADYSKGRSFLNVTSGMIDVKGFLSMGSQTDDGTYGHATFAGSNAELHMGGGTFRNQGSDGGSGGNDIGTITIGSGGIVSGSGKIIAGELFEVQGGLITPGGRWMYNFNRAADDILTCLGKLDITDKSDVATQFDNATFQTQLDRGIAANDADFTDGFNKSDRVVVRGALEIDNMNVNISRALTGDYVLIAAEGGITGYGGYDLNTLADDSLLLNLNGKPITQNDRIDRANGMYTTYDATAKEIRLYVETLTDGNVVTHWTGEGSTWDMVSKNFEATPTAGTKQFLDGDIVIFDDTWMDTNASTGNRTVHVTTDTKYTGTFRNLITDPSAGGANVVVAEVQVLGGNPGETIFTWTDGSILALDSALYTTLDQGDTPAQPTPSGELLKIGAGTLVIENSNEFYGGIHLGSLDGTTTGGKIELKNPYGFGTYNSMSGYQERGLVYVHSNTTIDVSGLPSGQESITNRFIVDPDVTLTFIIGGTFEISGNNALAGDAVEDGKGGGIFIGNRGSVVYSGSGGLKLTKNLADKGGGIYTELGYMLDVPADISGNYAQSGGGGIYAEKYFELKDNSSISGNTTNEAGGGIYVGNLGTIGGGESAEFILHGNTVVEGNMSGGETGGGIYVEAGRELILSSKKETKSGTDFAGGDIWFQDNWAKVEFDPDDPKVVVTSEEQIRNAIHLADTASTAGTFGGATLEISGPYNVYFYDPISGDPGTEITITGVQAQASNTSHTLPATQFGTVVFRDDSIFFGSTKVENGATFRLESFVDSGGTVEAVFGRMTSSLDPKPSNGNEFSLDADSNITGHGTVAADTIRLDGYVDLDTGTFTRPGGTGLMDGVKEDNSASATRDGSGWVYDTGTGQGVLKLDGTVTLADSAHWNLNLTNIGGNAPKTDLIEVTGSATFVTAPTIPGQKLELDVDDVVRGKYEIMKTTTGVANFNTGKSQSDAVVNFFDGATVWDLSKSNPDAADTIYSRVKAATYVEEKSLYLDVIGRNRHVTVTGNGNWGYNGSWAFDGNFQPTSVVPGPWEENDSGPATGVYLDGDMVTIDGAVATAVTLQSAVRPVDLLVTGASGQDVTISGNYGITTYATTGTGTYGPNGTTITTDPAKNDYDIRGYTGKLYKDGDSVLTFGNSAANTFTEGIVFGNDGADAGTIAFNNGNQLQVGTGKFMDFLYSGTLQTGTSTTLATNIRIEDAQTATFDITGGTLTQSGTIADYAAGDHGAMTKIGGGTLLLDARNTFTGGTTFAAGTIQIGGATDVPNTALGLFDNTRANPLAGVVTMAGSGTITNTAAQTIRNRFIVGNTAGNKLTFGNTATLTIDGVDVGNAVDGGVVAVLNTTDPANPLAFSGGGAITFSSNRAKSGGGIYNANTSLLTVSKALTFTSNQALAGSGGGLYAAGPTTFGTTLTANANTATGNGGGVYSVGNLIVSGATNLGNTAANTATVSGGGIYTDGTASFAALTSHRNVATTGSGGGVYSAGNLSVSGTANLGTTATGTGNTAGTSGGGIYTGGTASFAALNAYRNVAGTGGSGGAVYANGAVTISGAANIGSATAGQGNTAGVSGGGVYSATGGVNFSSTTANHVIGSNTAGTSGGGIHAASAVNLGGTGTKTITNNSVTGTDGKGGAIYAQDILLTGTANVTGNSAHATSGLGGAFYVDGGLLTLTPNLSTNTITFNNNAASSGQAVYLADDADVTISGAGDVLFYDTLVSTATGHDFTKNGTGTVMFAGQTSESNVSIFHGATNVNDGTFRITGGTSYGGAGTYTLSAVNTPLNAGARLTGGGTLTATTFELYGVVAPDSATGLTVADADRFGTLYFDGNVNMHGDATTLSYQYDVHLQAPTGTDAWKTIGTSDKLVVDGTFNAITTTDKVIVNLHNFGLGRYLLIDATTLNVDGNNNGAVNGIDGAGGAFDVTIHDLNKTARHEVEFMRGDGQIYMPGSTTEWVYAQTGTQTLSDATEAHNELWLATQYNNLYMYWTGAENATWANVDEQNGNWRDVAGSTGETHFENADSVVFGETIYTINPANRNITVAAAGVQVTNMLVDNTGTYTFLTGGGITTVDNFAGDVLTAAPHNYDHLGNVPQKLEKRNTGLLVFQNGANTFSGGIVFTNISATPYADAGTIAFNNANQLGAGSNGITFNENGTLRADAAIPLLTNDFHIADGKTATFDTNGFSVIYTGKIDEINSADTGNFIKTGSGVLRLSNGSNAWQGTTTISGGTLQAYGVASLGPAQNSVTSTTRTITNNASLEVDIASGSETLSQIIVGTGSVIKSGTGTLRLDQVNTYTGNTQINSTGTLIAQGVAALGTDAAGKQVSSTDGGTLNLEIAANETLLQRLTGTTGSGMNVTKSGAGTLTINRENDYIGTTNIDAGKVLITNVAGLGDNATVRTVTMASDTELEISLTAAGTFNKQLLGAGALTKTGAGVLTLTNTNTFTGGTDLNAGTITLGNDTALGTYLYAGTTPQNGQVNLNADGTTVMNTAARTIQNRFVVDDGLGTGATDGANITAENSLTVQNVDSSAANADGGAIHIGSGSKLTLTAGSTTAGQDITFTNNRDQAGANDIFMGTGSSLSVTGAQNTLIGSGIRGTGTVNKSGTGTMQIGANSAFNGATVVSDGTFRVNTGVSYGVDDSGTFSLTKPGTTGVLAGGGTIYGGTAADSINLAGTVRPDSATAPNDGTGTTRFGTLTLDGTVNLASTFQFDYNAGTAATSNGPLALGSDTSGYTVASNFSTGDLIKMTGGTSYTINNGATVNFVDSLSTGKYLIFIADRNFTLSGGNGQLDGIHAGGTLKSLGTTTTATPRGMYEFVWGSSDGTAEDIQSQIWLDVTRNSLTMTWTPTSTPAAGNVYTWNESLEDWISTQSRGGTQEKAYNDGDLVNINVATATTLNMATNRMVSGLNVGGASDLTIGGTNFGITAKTSDTKIEGEYLPAAQGGTSSPTLTPTGQLVKSGSGSLTFTNTGTNNFTKGIVINAGTIGFSAANQLGTLDTDGTTDHGITFAGTGTLRANASGQTLTNEIIITAAGTTANIYTQANTLTISGIISGAGNLTKSTGVTTGGILILSSSTGNSYDGTTSIETGTLRAMGVATLGTNAANRSVSIASGADLEVSVATGTETLDKQITGAGLVEKIGGGTLVLTHASNGYTGGTLVSGGRLIAETLGSAGSNATTGLVTIGTGTVFELKLDATEGGTFNQRMTGDGKFVKSGAETVTLSRNNDYTGNTEVTGGRIRITNVAAVGDNTATGASAKEVYLNGAGTSLELNLLQADSGTFNQLITGTGQLHKTADGTATLTNANTFTGGTELAAGGLTLNNVAALNTYTVSGGTKGLVDVTGSSSVTLGVVNGTYQNRFDITAGTFNLVNAAGSSNTIGNVVAGTGSNGGAVALADGTVMNVNNAGSLTFASNSDGNGANDIYITGTAALNFNGTGNVFIDGGIRGSGTVTKTAASTGITQIGANSAFDGTTTINDGNFRVVSTKSYGGTGSFSLADGATLSGGGTVLSTTGGNTINGKISPDNDTLSATKTTVDDDYKFGKLTLSGAATLDGFVMAYDADETKKQSGKATTADIDTGDLLRITGSSSLVGGTIDLQASSLDTGYYLIAESNTAFSITGGNGKLDGINDGGVLKLSLNGSTLTHLTPRTLYEFSYGANSAGTANARIWLHADTNSLTMDWNTGNGTWDSSAANWYSVQATDPLGTNVHEMKFRQGDYVRFNAGAVIALDTGTRIVSGMTVGDSSNANVSFTGDGGIHSKTTDASIVGKYLPGGSGAPELTPDGKLTKSGSGILTFANNGGNRFEKGIEINAGTLAFNQANQLGTIDVDGMTDNGINFKGNATLLANASAVLTNNVTVAAAKAGTIDPQGDSLTFTTGTVKVENGATLNLAGSGNQFYNTGIQANVAAAILSKTGAGTAQIGGDSVFNGTSNLNAGTFRVVDGVRYGGTGTVNLANGATLAGGGTVKADTIAVNGTISADTAVLSEVKPGVSTTEEERFGILTLEGTVILSNTFRMEYDAREPNPGSKRGTGDLLNVDGALTVNGGTINLRNTGTALTGSYHIIDSDRAITVGGTDIDLVLTATINDNPMSAHSIRGAFEFNMKESDTEIWLDVFHNSLNMVWQASTENQIWTASGGGENWLSDQGGVSPLQQKETVFNNGDYVHFTDLGAASGDRSIEVVGEVIVAGFEFDSTRNYTFTGSGGIYAEAYHATTEGQFLPGKGGTPVLTPDGKLNKFGTGVLEFKNIGGNIFLQGIELSGGTLGFTRANQLGDGGNGITFLENATLRADDTGQTLTNNIMIAAGKIATIDTQAHHLTMSGVVSGNALTKTGTGRLTLTGTNTYSGLTTVSAGTLEAVGVAALGVNDIANRILIANDAVLDVRIASGSQTLNKLLAGAGSVEKTGDGELVLSQVDNIYSGGTVVSAGTLTVRHVEQGGNNGGLGTGHVEIDGSAVLNFNIIEDGIYSKQISGEGKVEKSGGETLTLTNATSGYTGGTEILGGRITATQQNALGANVAAGIVNMSGAGTSLEFRLANGDTFNQKITGIGVLVQTGPGTLTLSNANTFSGGTQWDGGDLQLTNNAGLAATDGTAETGFVYVNTTGMLTTDTDDNTIANRFEIAANEVMTLGNELTIAGNNVAGSNGGAIELENDAGFTSDDPLHLTGNTTDGDGGAVYAPTEQIVVGGTGVNTIATLTGNSARGGGGVYAQSVSVRAQTGGITISGNTASGDGGAFYLVGGATASELDSTLGSITLEGNRSSAGANSIHLNENATLNIFGNHNIYLDDGITSKAANANGNVININLPYWTETNPIDMRDSGLFVNSVSDYYGDTNLNGGLMFFEKNSRFGTIAADNVFTQKTDGTLAGYGTISANEILLGGTINAGVYTPPPREHEVATLNFIGTTSIGTLANAGQTMMNVDIDSAATQQTADLMNVTGGLNIAGDSLVDFDTFSVGKYLIVRTSDGVGGYTPGELFDGEQIITDFESTVAGHVLNPNRFEITYTVERGDKDIYVNMTLHNEYLIWTGANAYVLPFSGEVTYVGNDEYRNDWLNERLYNWHQEKDGVSRDARFRQGDKVAFVGNDAKETAQPDYLARRENIEIVTFKEDDDTTGAASVAYVGDMVVTSGGTYRFTGRGIEASIDPFLPIKEEGAGQLYVNGGATAIFANAANNFQRGIVLQDGAVGFNHVDQLNTIFVGDTYNNGVTASHGIKVEGENSYGILYANDDDMVLGIVINIDEATSEMVIDTDGNAFGDSSVTGSYTLTLTHAETAGHTDPALGPVTSVNGIYGQGRLVKAGNGTLILADENSYKGGTLIEGGTVAVAADDRLGESGTSVTLDSGTLRAMESFTTGRTVFVSENGGAVEVDDGETLTVNGLLTDLDASIGIGDLSKTGEGTVVATNSYNDFRGDLHVKEGRFVATNVDTLGYNDASRTLYTAKNGDARSILELQIADEQTLTQRLGGDGEVRKTGSGQLNLAVNSPDFNGYLNVRSGSVYLTGDFGNGDSFRFAGGTTLSGYGTLGGNGDGGVFESGSILKPGNVVADNPLVNPTSRPISVNGSVTFDAGSIYQVVITQYYDDTYDPTNPDRMRPVSDCLNVTNGTVTIADGALLEVELDYWSDNLIPFDFGEDGSGRWTIIDASDNASANDTAEQFDLADVELPRGIEMEHGWFGDLYQLWLVGNPTGVFTEITDSHNTKEVGTVLEELVTSKDPGTKDLIKILSQKDLDDPTIVDIMRQMAGDLRADSLAMALKMPWRQPFNRLDRDMFPYVPDPCDPITCRKIHKHYEREFWGEAYGRYTDTRSDGNAYGNRITRAGTVIGVDKQINMYSLFGVAFNYSEPRMKQRTGRVELEDVEIGVYNMTKIVSNYDVKTYLGYSHQRYEMNRHVYIPAGGRYDALYESFENRTSGDGFAMSVELLRSFRYNDYVKFSPLLALDYEYVWQKGYVENGGMTALRHAATNLERLMMRVGMNVKAEVRDRLDLFGRIQYATQLNRTEYARGNTWFAAAEDPSVMDIHGVGVGRDYLNLGIGAEYFFKGTNRATSFYVNYDADFWKRQTTHTGNVGFVHRW